MVEEEEGREQRSPSSTSATEKPKHSHAREESNTAASGERLRAPAQAGPLDELESVLGTHHRLGVTGMLVPPDNRQRSVGIGPRPASTSSPQRRAAWGMERQPRSQGFLNIPRPVGRARATGVSEKSPPSLFTRTAVKAQQAACPRSAGTTEGQLQPDRFDKGVDERAQLLAMRRRTRALFGGIGQFSAASPGSSGRQVQSCARLSAALPVIPPPQVPKLHSTFNDPVLTRSTPRRTKAQVASPVVTPVSAPPAVATISSVDPVKPRVQLLQADTAEIVRNPNLLFRAVGAPLNGRAQRQPAQLQTTHNKDGRAISRCRSVRSSGSRASTSTSTSSSESIVWLHKNVATATLSTTERRRLESSRTNSRAAIYVLNAVLKRRADAQFEALAAEKAAAAQARAQRERKEGSSAAGQVTDFEVLVNTSKRTGGDNTNAAAREPKYGEGERVATQRSLLQGLTAAGVLSNQQCEAAVATLTTRKSS